MDSGKPVSRSAPVIRIPRTVLAASILFVLSFLFSYGPYLRPDQFGSPYPLGGDTVHYVREMIKGDRLGAVYFFPGSIDPRRGYVLITVLLHRLAGVSFILIEKFFPIVLSSLLSVVFYLIVMRYTDSKSTAFLAGFLAAIWPGRMRLTRDLHDCLLAYLLITVTFLIMMISLKANEKGDGSRKPSGLGIPIRALMLGLLLWYVWYTHIFTYAFAGAIIVAFSLFFLMRQRSKHQMKRVIKGVLSPLLISLALVFLYLSLLPPGDVGYRYQLSMYTLGMVTPSSPIPLSNLFDLFYGRRYITGTVSVLHIWGREGGYVDQSLPIPELGGIMRNLDLFNSIAMHVLIALGVLAVWNRLVGSKRFSDVSGGHQSTFLLSWIIVNYALIFGGALGGVRLGFVYRPLILLPIPIFGALGLSYLMKRFRLSGGRHRRADSIGSLVASLLLIAVLASVVTYGVYHSMYGYGAKEYWDDDLCLQLEELATWKDTNRPDKIPIFISSGQHWSLDQTSDPFWFELHRDRYEGQIEIFVGSPYLVYYGELGYLLNGTYTPYPDTWRLNRSRSLWENFTAEIKRHEPSDYDVYLVSSLYPIHSVEGGVTRVAVEVLPGIYRLRDDLVSILDTLGK